MKKNSLALAIALLSGSLFVGCNGSSNNNPVVDNPPPTADDNGSDGNDGGGMDIGGQFIFDPGFVAGRSEYTGLTAVDGVVYASRVDTRPVVGAFRVESTVEPTFDSVILRAAEGSNEFEVVQELDGKRVGGVDAITVVTGDEVDGVRPKDRVVIACYPAENTFDAAAAPEIVGLVAYRDDDLADKGVLVGEELTVPGSSRVEFAEISYRDFVPGQGAVLRQALTDCNDVSVAITEEVNTSFETQYAVLVSSAGIDTTQSTSSNQNIQQRSQAYFEPGFVYSWEDDSSNETGARRDRDIIYSGPYTQNDGSDQFLVDSVELPVFDILVPLVTVRDPNETDGKLGRTNVGSDGPVVNQDDNVFTGVDPDDMELSSLQQLPGTTRIVAVHDASEPNAKGLASFDALDAQPTGDGLPATTRFESLGQVGMDCLGALTFVSDSEGLCMSASTPGQFIFFDVPEFETPDPDGSAPQPDPVDPNEPVILPNPADPDEPPSAAA